MFFFWHITPFWQNQVLLCAFWALRAKRPHFCNGICRFWTNFSSSDRLKLYGIIGSSKPSGCAGHSKCCLVLCPDGSFWWLAEDDFADDCKCSRDKKAQEIAHPFILTPLHKLHHQEILVVLCKFPGPNPLLTVTDTMCSGPALCHSLQCLCKDGGMFPFSSRDKNFRAWFSKQYFQNRYKKEATLNWY